MLSTVPGLERPNASLRSENDRYVSLNVATTAFSFMKASADAFSSAISSQGSVNQYTRMLTVTSTTIQTCSNTKGVDKDREL